MLARWRRLYGASPLHLLSLAVSLTLSAYAASRLFTGAHVINVIAWFGLAIVGHDLVLFPLYSLLDRIAGRPARLAASGGVNYVRVPALLGALLLLVFLPSIAGLNAANYRADTSLGGGVFLARWLLICAALFLISAAAYALASRRHPVPPAPPIAGDEPPA